jgi:hypothetical protein
LFFSPKCPDRLKRYSVGTGVFPELKRSELELATHRLLVPRLRVSGAVLLLSLCGCVLWTKTTESAHNNAVWPSLDTSDVLASKCSFAIHRHLKNFWSQGNTGRFSVRRDANRARIEVV